MNDSPFSSLHLGLMHLGLNSGHGICLVTNGEDRNIDNYLQSFNHWFRLVLLHHGSLEQRPH